MEGPKIVIRQPRMHWTVQDHLVDLHESLRQGSERGGELVLFPELALTGLHTKVPELLDRSALEGALRSVGAACREWRIGAAVGAPVWAEGDRPHNAVVVFDPAGEEILRSPKLRLMPPGEPLVFAPGSSRPRLEHAGVTFAVVICREILDGPELSAELDGQAQVLLWPGVMARGPIDANNPEDYTLQAIRVAQEQRAWIVHSNWADHVQAPGMPHTGRSMVVSPSGAVVLEAPAQRPGLLLTWESPIDMAWIPSE